MELIVDSEEELEWVINRCSSAKYIKFIPKKRMIDPYTFQPIVSFSFKLEISDRDYTMWALRYAGKTVEEQFLSVNDIERIQKIIDKISIDVKK